MGDDLTRRTALFALGGAAGVASLTVSGNAGATTKLGKAGLTPTATDGPYYVDEKLVRKNIVEGKLGIPLDVELRLIDVGGKPVPNARVDVWHCDAQGNYSEYNVTGDHQDVPADGPHFLRGTQISDADGRVEYQTIYPGWYQSRTPHVHAKVYLGTTCVLTSQLYFPDALSEYIYDNIAVYQRREVRDTLNANDKHKARAGDSTVGAISEIAGGYRATLELTLDRFAHYPLEMAPPGHRPPYAPTMPILYGDARASMLVPKPKIRT